MNTDIEAVDPAEDGGRVQEIIIANNQRLVPVVSGGRLVGIITRTEFLRFLHQVRDLVHLGGEEDIPAEGAPARSKVVSNLVRERLPKALFGMLQAAGEVAERIGMNAYVVGGVVRDLLMRNENLDLDIVIEGDGIAFAEAFAREHPCRVRPHHKFGTAVLGFPDGYKMDIATARGGCYLPPPPPPWPRTRPGSLGPRGSSAGSALPSASTRRT